jgi:hypothetical protein
VQSTLPTLLLSGEFDPITPPEYADSILPGLLNAQHVVFPFGAHGQVGSVCGDDIIQRFVDAPTEAVDATCAATHRATFKTEQDLITIPALHGGLEGGVVGSLLGVGLSTVPGLLAVLFLMTALSVYLIGWIINRFRKRDPDSHPRDWTRAGPCLAFAATLAALLFLIGLVVALVNTIATNALLPGLGAVSSAFRPLFALPPLYLALVCAMLVATVALWQSKRGSLPGRIYYTALQVAAVVTLGSFVSLGVIGLWR